MGVKVWMGPQERDGVFSMWAVLDGEREIARVEIDDVIVEKWGRGVAGIASRRFGVEEDEALSALSGPVSEYGTSFESWIHVILSFTLAYGALPPKE